MQAERLSNELADSVMQSRAAMQLLNPGRVVVVKSQSVSSFAFFPSIRVSPKRKQGLTLPFSVFLPCLYIVLLFSFSSFVLFRKEKLQ